MPEKEVAVSGQADPTRPAHNIRLVIEFDGSGFAGWQYQPRHRTIQGEMESALAKLLGRSVTVHGCSRTDAGVSARNYVANFLLAAEGYDRIARQFKSYPQAEQKSCLNRLCRALNFHLPGEILVKHAEEASLDFHARHSAKSKTYTYRIVLGRSPLRSAQAWELRSPVDAKRMRRALGIFSGRHDFNAFCHLGTDAPAFCKLLPPRLTAGADELTITVQGDRFLYKMVRRIVGAAVAYGAGSITLADIRAAMAGKKHQPFQTAPACGLLLDSVNY